MVGIQRLNKFVRKPPNFWSKLTKYLEKLTLQGVDTSVDMKIFYFIVQGNEEV